MGNKYTTKVSPIDENGNALCPAMGKRGHPCKMRAGFGTDHVGFGCCKYHLGTTPAVSKPAYAAMAREVLASQPITMGLRDLDPTEGLLMLIRKSASFLAWLEAKVEDSGGEAMWYEDEKGVQRPTVYVTLYNEERSRLESHCATALRLGLQERQVQLAEQQGQLIVAVIQGTLEALGLTPEQMDRAPMVVQQQLNRVVEARVVVA